MTDSNPNASNLIHADGQVLAAIDSSPYGDSVAEHAAWAAKRMVAPLEFLHAIERSPTPAGADLSGNLSLGSQEQLLADMAELDAQRGKLAQRHGRLLLEQAAAHAKQTHDVDAGQHQRHGTLVDALLEAEPEVRLFVLGKRGEHADFDSGHLGSQLERVMRAVHRPVLVASRAFRPIQRFLIAFDGSATTRKCVEMVAASPLLRGLDCHLLLVGDANHDHAADLDWARSQLQAAGFDPQLHVQAGTPDTVIAQQVTALDIDLLVMGAYGHSRIRQMIVGSTTTQVLRSCQIPVLLLR